MEKQDKIKEAYVLLFDGIVERYEAIEKWICKNGWFSGTLKNISQDLLDISGYEVRPKSLEGIENNNGWIKIESKDDLPNNGEYYAYSEKYKTKEVTYFDGDEFIIKGRYPFSEPSHYALIIEPQPPIY